MGTSRQGEGPEVKKGYETKETQAQHVAGTANKGSVIDTEFDIRWEAAEVSVSAKVSTDARRSLEGVRQDLHLPIGQVVSEIVEFNAALLKTRRRAGEPIHYFLRRMLSEATERQERDQP